MVVVLHTGAWLGGLLCTVDHYNQGGGVFLPNNTLGFEDIGPIGITRGAEVVGGEQMRRRRRS